MTPACFGVIVAVAPLVEAVDPLTESTVQFRPVRLQPAYRALVSGVHLARRTTLPAAARRRACELCVVRTGCISDRIEQALTRNAGLETGRGDRVPIGGA